LPSWAKQTQLGEISLIYCQSKQSKVIRNKSYILKHLPPALLSSQAQLCSRFFSTCSPRVAQGSVELGEGGVGWLVGWFAVSSSHVVSATPSPLHSAPAPPWGPSHRRQSSSNCSNVSPSHRLHSLLQHGLTTGSQAPPANLLQPALLSPQVLPGACSSAGSPRGHSLLQASLCSGVGSSPGCG